MNDTFVMVVIIVSITFLTIAFLLLEHLHVRNNAKYSIDVYFSHKDKGLLRVEAKVTKKDYERIEMFDSWEVARLFYNKKDTDSEGNGLHTSKGVD